METNDIVFKSGFVSIIGLPNAGKSTFLNAIIKENIAITSRKPQTTRKNLKGIYNDENSQIVFVDTPGINSGKTMLDKYMERSVSSAIDDIDLMVLLVDINTYETDDYTRLVNISDKSKAKKILVINKCDVYDGDVKIAENDILQKLCSVEPSSVLFISALKKKNIAAVIDTIKSFLDEGLKYYYDDYLTDEPLKKIISDMIRQQCLYKLDKEIPHSLEVVVDSMKTSKSKCLNIMATIVCDKESHKKIVIGTGGSMIKNIGTGARINIEKFMHQKVNLKTNVIVRENWRDEKTLLANYGYDMKEFDG